MLVRRNPVDLTRLYMKDSAVQMSGNDDVAALDPRQLHGCKGVAKPA